MYFEHCKGPMTTILNTYDEIPYFFSVLWICLGFIYSSRRGPRNCRGITVFRRDNSLNVWEYLVCNVCGGGGGGGGGGVDGGGKIGRVVTVFSPFKYLLNLSFFLTIRNKIVLHP